MRFPNLYGIAVIGNILEHYDRSLYSFLIPFLAPLFFPCADPIYSLLAVYALLPLGFLFKPLGAYIFGQIGDRWGRRSSLSISLLGMAFATGTIGCIPTFEQIGWMAPALLSLGRLLQTFFSAGETTGNALFLLEATNKKKQGLVSSLFDASGIAGVLLAALAATLLGATHWRWLFWIGSFSGITGLIIRKNFLKESQQTTTNWQWQKSDWIPTVGIAAVAGFSYANYYLLSSFLNGFLPLIGSITTQEALTLNIFLLILDFCLLPFFGWLSLHLEKELLMITAALLGCCLALPLFLVLEGASAWIAGGVRIVFTIIGVCLAAPYHAWAMEMAPPDRRFTVCAIGSAGGKLIGAPMPAIALWLYHSTGWVGSPAIPLIASACCATGAILYLKNKMIPSRIS